MAWTNGFYRGTSTSHILDVRIDLGSSPDALQMLSCDLYQISPPVYLGTFRSAAVPSLSGTRLETDLMTWPDEIVRARLRLDEAGSGVLSALFTWQGPGSGPASPILFQLGHMTTAFREIVCEVDRDENVPLPDPAPHFTANPAADVTWQGCFRKAGIELLPSQHDSLIDTSSDWTRAELHRALHTRQFFGSFSDKVEGSVYLLLVRRLRGEDKAGLMFDPSGRRGAAVFYDAIRSQYPDGPELRAVYNWAVVHELGHTLNLPHAFEDASLADEGASSLTFMNYPHFYAGMQPARPGVFTSSDSRTAVHKFWSNFDYQFARNELRELRHGNLFDVLMGGSAYRGDVSAAQLPSRLPASLGGQAPHSLQLELRLSPARQANLFAFGEPVHVEVKVRASGRPVEFEGSLDPADSSVEFHIRQPDGTVVVFDPPIDCVSLAPRRVLTPERPSAYADVCLSYSATGFTFDRPGRYHVQCLCRQGDVILVSGTLPVFVRYPTEKEERFVVPTFTGDVSAYFILRGAPHLTAAVELLDALEAELPEHPLVHYYNAYKALTSTAGFRETDKSIGGNGSRKRVATVEAKPDTSLYAKSLGAKPSKRPTKTDLQAPSVPFSNIFFEELLRNAVAAWSEVNPRARDAFFKTAKETLTESRGIPLERVVPAKAAAFWSETV